MTSLNLGKEPLRTIPLSVERPPPFSEIRTRSQQYRIKRMATLLRHKDNLLRETHHRVGNSLQIVASILSMDARNVHSKVARVHLENAHRRILAVATVQRELQTVRDGGDLELAPYLSRLCENLTASVVDDAARIAIEVRADPCVVSPADGMNVGLIVTELVINALKHAFMSDAGLGRVRVTYRLADDGWTLTVADNGVGRPIGQSPPVVGLGTGIVAALAKQLHGRIEISTGLSGIGTSVSIVGHRAGRL